MNELILFVSLQICKIPNKLQLRVGGCCRYLIAELFDPARKVNYISSLCQSVNNIDSHQVKWMQKAIKVDARISKWTK